MMKLLRRCAAFLLPLTSLAVLAQIPSPEQHLGFRVGEDRKLADWDQVTSYFQKVAAAAPDRVKFEEIGKTTEGKPFVYLTISSPENLKNLEHYRQIQQRLADPRGLDPAAADRLIHEGKAVVLITCTVHSTEVASTQTAMEYVYKLLTENTPEHQEILNNVIFLLVPSLNPDGQDMVVKWYRKYVGTPYEGMQPVELYNKYVGHDDNRDWYMFTQVESQLTVSKVQNPWHPEVVYDVHQMGSNAARLFVPPFLDPVDPNVDPLIVQETNMLGTSMAGALATAGKQGVAINAIYDFWTPARHYQAYHGGLRVLTESASARLASPIRISFSQLDQNALGYNAQQASWNFPDPWRGGDWHLRDIVDYQLIAYEACLRTVAQDHEMFLRNFYNIAMRAVNRKGSPYAFVIPPDQHDLPTTVKMLNTLRFGEVEIQQAKAPFAADGMQFPADSWVILFNQPYGSYAKTLLERQKYPDLREYPGGPPKRPYDVTAQTLPLLMGVRTYEIEQPFAAEMAKQDKIEVVSRTYHPHGPYSLQSNSAYAFLTVNELLKAGIPVARVRSAMPNAPAGDFIISGDLSRVKVNIPPGLELAGVTVPASATVPLKAPRIGIYASYQPSMDEGWTRWLLDQFEFAYTQIHDKDVRAGNLNSRFDVIIIPDEQPNAIANGLRNAGGGAGSGAAGSGESSGGGNEAATQRAVADNAGRIPEEFTGGLGSQGVEALKLFVAQGGTLITLNGASNFAIERLGVGARNVLQGVPNKDFYGPGSLLRVDVDTSNPLAWGMERDAAIWFEHGPAFAPSFQRAAGDVMNVATYPAGNPLMSGWLLGDQLLQGHSALIDAPLGQGHVVMFGFRPQYRGQSYGTFKLLFNALYYFGPVTQRVNQAPKAAD
ncbi:MAG TPA: M14 metallopeptidase family protein [Terriglobales bacterium]|nr:M14 metallopeptidase family protein [Terriglobales bacterium]